MSGETVAASLRRARFADCVGQIFRDAATPLKANKS
jgi:hypothetical protein